MSVLMPGMSLDHQRVKIKPKNVREFLFLI